MATQTSERSESVELTVRVSPRAAAAYERADEAKRQQIELLIELKLLQPEKSANDDLREALASLQEEAARQRLTREEIQDLLEVDDEEMDNLFRPGWTPGDGLEASR